MKSSGKVIGGTICLALALMLGVLNFVLPPENLMFTVGDANMPWIPPLLLGIVGIVLLITAAGGQETAVVAQPAETTHDPEKAALNKRMEGIAWGCFLIMLGGFMFIPDTVVAKGVWSIGVGAIMLGLNLARYLNHIKMSGFTTFLGILAVLSGIFELFTAQSYDGALLLIILGAYLLLKPWFEKQKLFGPAEQS